MFSYARPRAPVDHIPSTPENRGDETNIGRARMVVLSLNR